MQNDYDDLVEKIYGTPKTDYDSMVEASYQPDPEKYQQAQFAAKKITPDESVQAFKYSREKKVPVQFVQPNLNKFKEADEKTDMTYDAIIEKSPRLAKWLEDPYKAAAVKDDLKALSQIERNADRIKPYQDSPGLGEFLTQDLPSATMTGVDNLEVSALHLAASHGLTDIESWADRIAEKNKQIREKQKELPVYAKEFQKVMEEKGGNTDRAFNYMLGAYDTLKEGKILQALNEFETGKGASIYAVLDQIYTAGRNPRGTIRSVFESLAFSGPALATGAAAGKIGAVGGGLAAGPGGAGVGGLVGFTTGVFSGSAATETGAWINQALEERGYDVTDPKSIVAAYKDKKVIADIRAEAQRKGVTTAGIDALFAAFGGKLLSGAKVGSTAGKIARGAGDVAIQSVGEGASELGGQVAARKGDMSKVSIGESVFEGIASIGQSVGTTVIAGSFRQALSPKVTDAAVETAERVNQAQSDLSELQALEQLVQVASESKTMERDAEFFSEFVADANINGGADQAVYMQKDQWDEMWRELGESPVERAEEFLATESYDNAEKTGQPIEIKLKDFVAKMGEKPEYGSLLQIARTKPDGLTAAEAVDVIKQAPGTVQDLANEAKEEQAKRAEIEKQEKAVKDRLVGQLKAANRDPIEADLIMAFYRTVAEKEGLTVDEFASKFNLNIGQASDQEITGQVYEQPEIPAQERPAFYSKMAEIINKKVQGKAATVDQIKSIIKEAKADEIKWSGIEQFLEGKDKVSKDELMDFVEKSLLPIETVVLGESTGDYAGAEVVYNEKNDVYDIVFSDGSRDGGYADQEIAQRQLDKIQTGDATKFSQYTLPGGENYREVLFVLPQNREMSPLDASAKYNELSSQLRRKYGDGIRLKATPDEISELDRLNKLASEPSPKGFTSPHFEQENILAHVRLNDRVDSEGNRVLFVEEIQSDWHQAGRKKGYKEDVPKEVPAGHKLFEDTSVKNPDNKWQVRDADNRISGFGPTPEAAIFNHYTVVERMGAVPDAPFKKNWHEFALKRIIDMAVRGGYDKIAWTTGEQQAERYDLSKQVEEIKARKQETGSGIFYHVQAYKGGERVIDKDGLSESELEGAIGKDLAKKIIDGEGKATSVNGYGKKAGWKSFSGLDLKVGGEGMKGFYDNILVKFANKFGKKYGSQVSDERIAAGEKELSSADRRNQQIRNEIGDLTLEDFVLDTEDSDKDRSVFRAGEFSYMIAHYSNDSVIFSSPQEPQNRFKNVEQMRDALFSELTDNTEFKTAHSLSVTPEMRQSILNEGQEFYQQSRGRIRVLPNNNYLIELFKNADKSTMIHELGHYFLEVMKQISSEEKSSQEIKDDFQTIIKWLGVESADQIKTEHHEKWARGFEAYVREGKAPSNALRRAFNTFKVWLTNIYKRVTQLDVEINDDIRGVMDRMLATEYEIQQAKASMGDIPMFIDPIASGMNQAQAKRYSMATGEAEMKAKERHLRKLEKDVIKRKKIQAKINRERIENFVKEEPLYKAIVQLKSKEEPGLKFSRKLFKEQFPELYGSNKFRGMFADDESGMGPDVVASIVGYDSGQELVQAIFNSPTLKAVVDAEVERMTNMQFQKEESPEVLTARANEALHNESRAKRLLMEAEHLASNHKGLAREIVRRVTRRPAPSSEIRDVARKLINATAVGTVRPNQYRLAERRYAKESGELLAKGDIQGAFMAKERERLNHYLFVEASAAKETLRKTEKLAKKFFQKDDKLAKTRDMDLISAGRAVLSRFGFGTSRKEPLQHLAAIKAYNPDAYETVASIINGILNEADNFNNITMGQLADLRESIQALWDLSLDMKQVESDGEKIQIAQAIGKMNQQLNVFRGSKEEKQYNETATKEEIRDIKLLGLKSALRRFENWVDVHDMGNVDGPFRKFLWTPVSEALDAYFEKKKDFKKRLIDMSKPLQNRPEFLNEIIAPELTFEGRPFKFKTKYELLGALLHTGNESNMRKLLIGYGWGSLDSDGTLITTNWDKFVKSMWDEGVLTKQDYDYIQGVWDLMEEIKPMAQHAHKKVMGYYFDEITAKEIETPFGKYRGGYAPAKVDPYAVSDIARRAELEAFVKAQPAYSWPAAGGKGFTIGRVMNFNKPLMLNISLVGSHIDEALRFAMVKPAVVDAAKIVTNQDFKTLLGEFDPTIINDMILPALNRADKNKIYVDNAKIPEVISRLANALRRNSAMQLMFGNIKNTAEQSAGLAVAGTRINPKYLAASTSRYMLNPKRSTELVREKSQAMRTRGDEQMFEIERQAREIFRTEKELLEKAVRTASDINEWGARHAFFTQAFTQNIIDSIVWQASYDESIANGLGEKSAIRKADADIRLTQTSRRPVDVAGIETHQWLNFFNMFYSFFITMANLNADNFTKLYYEDLGLGKKSAKGFYMYMMGFASLAVVSALFGKAAAGGLDEDGDDEIADDLFDVFIGSQLELGFAMVPVLGSGIAAGYHEMRGTKPYLTKVSASPAASAIGNVSRTLGKLGKGELTDSDLKNSEIRDSLNALGVLTGMPIGPAARPITYIRDVESGKAQPSGPIDYMRGLVTGKPGVK